MSTKMPAHEEEEEREEGVGKRGRERERVGGSRERQGPDSWP